MVNFKAKFSAIKRRKQTNQFIIWEFYDEIPMNFDHILLQFPFSGSLQSEINHGLNDKDYLEIIKIHLEFLFAKSIYSLRPDELIEFTGQAIKCNEMTLLNLIREYFSNLFRMKEKRKETKVFFDSHYFRLQPNYGKQNLTMSAA